MLDRNRRLWNTEGFVNKQRSHSRWVGHIIFGRHDIDGFDTFLPGLSQRQSQVVWRCRQVESIASFITTRNWEFSYWPNRRTETSKEKPRQQRNQRESRNRRGVWLNYTWNPSFNRESNTSTGESVHKKTETATNKICVRADWYLTGWVKAATTLYVANGRHLIEWVQKTKSPVPHGKHRQGRAPATTDVYPKISQVCNEVVCSLPRRGNTPCPEQQVMECQL